MSWQRAFEFLMGLLFGLGLMLAGMTNPAKVLAFLDLAGAWDPSLALVMGGGIAVGLGAFAIAKRRQRTLLGGPLMLPAATTVDRRLLVGSALFGVGWGLAGFCPGPAFVSLGLGDTKVLVFIAAMLAGMACFELLEARRAKRA
ncbi:MAG: YeeE/YedE family protein [Rhodoferax sp.]|nr:YeeE/YedE family protein [Rhodoferax sp.]